MNNEYRSREGRIGIWTKDMVEGGQPRFTPRDVGFSSSFFPLISFYLRFCITKRRKWCTIRHAR